MWSVGFGGRVGWCGVSGARQAAPTSVSDWLVKRDTIYKTFAILRVALPKTFVKNHYHLEWLIRIHFIIEMRQARVKLDIQGATCWEFAKMSLDQKVWVPYLCRRAEGKSVRWLMDRVGYTDHPELFSMWCCILLCDRAFSLGPMWFKKHESDLIKIMNTSRPVPYGVASLVAGLC
jgi:hypothetical protein